MNICTHDRFTTVAEMARLVDPDTEEVVMLRVKLKVTCSDCGLPFRFVGLPTAESTKFPTVNPDATELRAPVEPAYAREVFGIPALFGHA
jgi:hypothetical protein